MYVTLNKSRELSISMLQTGDKARGSATGFSHIVIYLSLIHILKLENLFNGLHENIDFLEKKIEQYQNDLEASKAEYDKPFAYSKELEEKLARQCELNAQLDLENAKAVDADLSGPEEEREADDRMESAAIVAEDKGGLSLIHI